MVFWQVTYGIGNTNFDQPSGIAVRASDNHVFVADYGNARIVEFTDTGAYVAKFGSFGATAGLFDRPVGVGVDSSGYIYVSDDNQNRIQKFGP